MIQVRIKQTLSEEANLAIVRRLLAQNGGLHRTEFAERVCQRFAFHDGTGKPQLSGCLKALRKLEAQGRFVLPEARRKTGAKRPRRLSEPLAQLEGLPERIEDLRGLELVLVENEGQMRIWNEMMLTDHPNGAGPLVGRQLRYLIGSDYGWLGGFGFGAAALQLAPREEWIGWEGSERGEHLHRVVGLSRFLIRSQVRCSNLASHVLARAMETLPGDFEKRYGYEPYLVESFVDTSAFSGTVYRAGNWTRIGRTRGRGRQDRNRQAAKPVKEIYVYPLCKDFRERMGLAAQAGEGQLCPAEGLEGEDWAKKELGKAPLGDKRLGDRLVEIAAMKAEDPTRSFCGVAKGDWPKIKGYYRLIDKPEGSAVNMENILAPHRKRTLRRMKGQRTVLAVSDGSDLNYEGLEKCEGLGVIGTNQTGVHTRGLHLHSTLAVSSTGVVLGVLDSQCEAPQLREDPRPTPSIPVEEKESHRWIASLTKVMEAAAEMPGTRVVNVCDRAADFYECFLHQKQNPCVELLVRAKYNRPILAHEHDECTGEREGQGDVRSKKIFDTLKGEPVKKRIKVKIERKSARSKKAGQKARAKQPGRDAVLSLRYRPVRLAPPTRHKGKETLDLWVIHALEENPPEGAKPVEWFLLTTMELDSPETAAECVRWYCLRWRIEDWHRVLKSGCRIEELAHESAERLRRAIAINLVVAWRVMLMTLLKRKAPELPSDVLFSDIELEVLGAYAKKKALKPPVSLGEAVLLVAKLGGYIARKNDPPPGHQIIWHGYNTLQLMSEGFALKKE